MSIVASVKVRDGIILGADSATQIHGEVEGGGIQVLKIYYHAQKLFRVGGRLGILTYGAGNIGQRSVQGVLRDFAQEIVEIPEEMGVKGISDRLRVYLENCFQDELPKLEKAKWPQLGILVAGYSSDKHHAEEWEFLLPRHDSARPVRPAERFGASWRGVNIPFTRLFKGVDPRLRQKLLSATEPKQRKNLEQLFVTYEPPVLFDAMPLQDAIHFVEFILQTTTRQVQFELGPPTCGGPILLAAITRHKGFEWIRQPQLRASGAGSEEGYTPE